MAARHVGSNPTGSTHLGQRRADHCEVTQLAECSVVTREVGGSIPPFAAIKCLEICHRRRPVAGSAENNGLLVAVIRFVQVVLALLHGDVELGSYRQVTQG